MEDVAEEPLINIDSGDKKNPLAVVEYIDDLYAHYKKVEVYQLTCFLRNLRRSNIAFSEIIEFEDVFYVPSYLFNLLLYCLKTYNFTEAILLTNWIL